MTTEPLYKNEKELNILAVKNDIQPNFLRKTIKELPVFTWVKPFDINRTSMYYGGFPVSQRELECKAIIDYLHTDNPIWGAR